VTVRTVAAYRRMVEPGVIEVDADDSADRVLQHVIDLLNQHSVPSPPPTSSSSSAAAAASISTTD